MAFDFPNSPINGQTVTGVGGIVYTYDGVKWTVSVSSTAGAPATNTVPLPDGVGAVGAQLQYARGDHVHPLAPNIGRNLLHNPLFNVAQRGAGPFTTGNPFTMDRWQQLLSNDTVSIIQQPVSDAQRAQIGDEAAEWCYLNTFTGNAAAGAYNLVIQRMEKVRRLAGKTVTVSFWAIAGAGTPKLGVQINQLFGSGGSPSADVVGTGQAVTISTTFARYSMTIAIPSVGGKTLGSNGNDCTQLAIWFSSGATNNAFAGGIGVQSGTIAIWGVQLEIGSVATPLEKPDPRYDLANCQRFYQLGAFAWFGYGASSYNTQAYPLSVQMRATPTIATNVTSSAGCTSPIVDPISSAAARLNVQCAANGTSFNFVGTFTASADL